MPVTPPKTTGFSRAAVAVQERQRLICSVDAMEKCGKTHFGLSGPRPLGFIDFDEGLEGVAQKFPLDEVFVSSLGAQFSEASTMAVEGHKEDRVAKAANKVWAQFREDYIWGLENLRGLVIDTGTEMHELIRLARFGKLTQVMPEHYGPVYGELTSLIKRAYASNCSLIILHRLKAEYEQVAEKTSTGKRQPGRKTGPTHPGGLQGHRLPRPDVRQARQGRRRLLMHHRALPPEPQAGGRRAAAGDHQLPGAGADGLPEHEDRRLEVATHEGARGLRVFRHRSGCLSTSGA